MTMSRVISVLLFAFAATGLLPGCGKGPGPATDEQTGDLAGIHEMYMY